MTMSTNDTATRTLTVRQTESVSSASRIRHVDELSEDALQRLVELVQSGGTAAQSGSMPFVDGEVIVFTEYYRIEFR